MSLCVPVNVPHPESALLGGGVPEIPQPPDSVSWSSVPLGFLLENPVSFSHETPPKLTVAVSPLPSVIAKAPRNRSHCGLGPGETGVAVAGLNPTSAVTKKFVTVLRSLPEIVAGVTSLQEQLPELEQL